MKFFHRRIFGLIITLVSLMTVVGLSRSIYDLWRKRDIVGDRQRELNRVEAENKRLKEELKQVQGQEFVEREAREKLGMTREGEVVVILPKSQISNPNDQKKTEDVSNWKSWWGLFF